MYAVFLTGGGHRITLDKIDTKDAALRTLFAYILGTDFMDVICKRPDCYIIKLPNHIDIVITVQEVK